MGRVAHATTADLDDAMDTALRGLETWSAMTTWDRGAIMKKSADILRSRARDLGTAMTREQGKPLAQATAEVERSADFMEWGGEQARRITTQVLTGREPGNRIAIETHPIGVVAAFTPWNFPMALAAKKFAGALGAGCAIPPANARRVEAISELVEDARGRGADILTGGERIGNTGTFYKPTVLTNVPADAKILHEEPFGPVAPILRFGDEAEMLDRANGLPFGLSGYLFTDDPVRQRRLSDALKVGTLGVNDVQTHLPEVPLGGWKESGYGTEGGQQILQPYQKTKFVSYR